MPAPPSHLHKRCASCQAAETPVIFEGGSHGGLGVCDTSRVFARMAAECIHTNSPAPNCLVIHADPPCMLVPGRKP